MSEPSRSRSTSPQTPSEISSRRSTSPQPPGLIAHSRDSSREGSSRDSSPGDTEDDREASSSGGRQSRRRRRSSSSSTRQISPSVEENRNKRRRQVGERQRSGSSHQNQICRIETAEAEAGNILQVPMTRLCFQRSRWTDLPRK